MAGGFPVEEQNEGGKYIRLCGCRGGGAELRKKVGPGHEVGWGKLGVK